MPQELVFKPYDRVAIVSIIESRLKELAPSSSGHLVQVKALELLARKVAKVGGDIRDAIDICGCVCVCVLQSVCAAFLPSHAHALLSLSLSPSLPPPCSRLVGRTAQKFGANIFDPSQEDAIVSTRAMAEELRLTFGNKMHERMRSLPIHACYMLCTLVGVLTPQTGPDGHPVGKSRSSVTHGKLADVFVRIATSQHVNCSRSSVSDVLSQLEAHGFITKRSIQKKGQTKTPRKMEIKLTVSLMVRSVPWRLTPE